MSDIENLSSLERLVELEPDSIKEIVDLQSIDDVEDNQPELKKQKAEIMRNIEKRSSEPSFGNMYDDNTVKFLAECRSCGVEIPRSINLSVNDSTTDIVERSYDGGMLGIDKSLMRDKLKQDFEAGKITKTQLDDLNGRLNDC